MSTSAPVIEVSKEKEAALAKILYIYYLLCFQKNINEIQALINFGSKVNVMTPIYTSKLGLQIRQTNVKAQKIDSSTLETLKMVLASFQIEDKLGKAYFFQKIFLLINVSIKIVLQMPFLTLSNTDI